jgi:integrase
MVHWQAGDRPLPAQRVTVSGESALWVDPAEIPSDDDIGKLGRALADGRHGERDELMASTAAYSGLRWGELTALTIWQVDQAGRVIIVDRQVIEVAGHLYTEAPKCRKYRKTIYPRRTPDGYPLADKLAARIEHARAELEAGTNPLGLIFPSPTGKHWPSSNFNRNVLKRAYLAIGWRDADGNGKWTWHSLRHVFCTTALFTLKLDPTDVSCMAGHANVRTTLLMYVGSTAGRSPSLPWPGSRRTSPTGMPTPSSAPTARPGSPHGWSQPPSTASFTRVRWSTSTPRDTASRYPPWPAGCSHSASSRHWPPTWPRAGPTAQWARSSRPGQRSAWWAATSCPAGGCGVRVLSSPAG